MLDNKEIAPVERKKAEVVLKKEESILNMLFSNECLLMKLQLVRISLSYIQYIFFLAIKVGKVTRNGIKLQLVLKNTIFFLLLICSLSGSTKSATSHGIAKSCVWSPACFESIRFTRFYSYDSLLLFVLTSYSRIYILRC